MRIKIIRVILMIIFVRLLLVVAFLIVMSGKKHIVEVLSMVEHVMKEQMEVFIVRILNSKELFEKINRC